MSLSHDAGDLPTTQHENFGEFKTFACAQSVLNFIIKPAQLAQALLILGTRPTCLQPLLAGGSTVNSSSQLQPNKSQARSARIPVYCCLAATLSHSSGKHSHCWRYTGQSQDSWERLAANLSFQAILQPAWVAGKSKLMS
jgi:hypothetical protein